jgi:SAM-dependent methyltransferase
MSELIERMRRDWDDRARSDAKYYVACQRRNQSDEEFDGGAQDIVARARRDYPHLPAAETRERRFLEIGCGLGRLMRSLAVDCGEIHGVDISPEMAAVGRTRLAHIPHAHFHVARNNDLAAFASASFDFVFSYAVFQHIPERALVFRYIDEAFRVLKPGGVFTAQFNGAPPVEARCDTWVGAWLPERELLEHARESGWLALSIEGADTQYLWLTLKKPATKVGAGEDSLRATIQSVSHPDGRPELVAGGPRGFATLWVAGIPEDCCTLTELALRIGEQAVPIRYLGPSEPNGARQINAQIPETAPLGANEMTLAWRGRRVSNAVQIVVAPCPPMRPRIVRVTDGQDISQHGVVSCDTMQVSLEGCQDIGSLEVSIAGQPVEAIALFCVDPLSRFYLFNVRVPEACVGRQTLRISVDGEALPEQQVLFAKA